MKKIFFIALLLTGSCMTGLAQVTLQPAIASVGLIQKDQLWNLSVINSSTNHYECRLELVLRDRMTGQEMLTASSTIFTLAPGAKQLNVNVLSPVLYNQLTAGADTKLQGLLPAGNYIACYTLAGTDTKAADLAEECVQFDAAPLSPPMLIFPADSAVLDVAPAQFSWTPPTPAGMFDRLHYEVLVTEVQEGQKADEAIQQNLPFYNEEEHINNQLNYPSTSQNFEKDKWYAWQIVAKDDRNYAGKSETWVFKISAAKKDSIAAESFADAKPYYTGKKYYFTNTIRFSFINPYISKKLEYAIIHVATKKQVGRLPEVVMGKGLNNISLDVSAIRGLRKNEQYTIEIYNIGNSTHYINFIIKE